MPGNEQLARSADVWDDYQLKRPQNQQISQQINQLYPLAYRFIADQHPAVLEHITWNEIGAIENCLTGLPTTSWENYRQHQPERAELLAQRYCGLASLLESNPEAEIEQEAVEALLARDPRLGVSPDGIAFRVYWESQMAPKQPSLSGWHRQNDPKQPLAAVVE